MEGTWVSCSISWENYPWSAKHGSFQLWIMMWIAWSSMTVSVTFWRYWHDISVRIIQLINEQHSKTVTIAWAETASQPFWLCPAVQGGNWILNRLTVVGAVAARCRLHCTATAASWICPRAMMNDYRGSTVTLSPIIMEVEDCYIWKLTNTGGTHFWIAWLWEEV